MSTRIARHAKAFGGMYDNSPYRHDVVKMRTRQKKKRNAEESHQAQIDKVLAKLAAMTGTDETFVGAGDGRRTQKRWSTRILSRS